MSTLLIIRTPFQAWLARKVLAAENIESFDLIYFTQNDSEEDSYYFSLLSQMAKSSYYCYVKPSKFSILSYIIFKLKTLKYYRNLKYDLILLASIEALYITSLIRHHYGAKLITFDDGAANIFQDDLYYTEPTGRRHAIYRYFMRSLSLEQVKKLIVRHYTMYDSLPNIVAADRLVHLEKMTNILPLQSKKGLKTYFIGAPFEEVMTQDQIVRLERYVSSLKIDAYVKHPRERKVLDIKTPFLVKAGKIAEEAIVYDAEGKNIVLIGWFSTVMLNMGNLCSKRIVLLAKDSSSTKELTRLSKASGCEVVLI